MGSVPECVNAGQLLNGGIDWPMLVFENIARDIAGLPRIEREDGLLKRLFKRGS